jgi:hypothetical protein
VPGYAAVVMIKRQALEATALEERVIRRDQVPTMAALKRQASIHFRHHFEVVPFYTVRAANRVENGHKMIDEKS